MCVYRFLSLNVQAISRTLYSSSVGVPHSGCTTISWAVRSRLRTYMSSTKFVELLTLFVVLKVPYQRTLASWSNVNIWFWLEITSSVRKKRKELLGAVWKWHTCPLLLQRHYSQRTWKIDTMSHLRLVHEQIDRYNNLCNCTIGLRYNCTEDVDVF